MKHTISETRLRHACWVSRGAFLPRQRPIALTKRLDKGAPPAILRNGHYDIFYSSLFAPKFCCTALALHFIGVLRYFCHACSLPRQRTVTSTHSTYTLVAHKMCFLSC